MEANLQGFREDFESSLDDSERAMFEKELIQLREPAGDFSDLVAFSARDFVQNWTVDELIEQLEAFEGTPINHEAGGKYAAEALCLRCHQFNNRGGHIGPDLTTVGKRMDVRTLLESILEPSKSIDPKYNNVTFVMEDGQVVTGRTTMVTGASIGVEVDPLTGRSVAILRDQIEESRVSAVSPMPQGLINTLTVEEIYQLLSFLRDESNAMSARK